MENIMDPDPKNDVDPLDPDPDLDSQHCTVVSRKNRNRIQKYFNLFVRDPNGVQIIHKYY